MQCSVWTPPPLTVRKLASALAPHNSTLDGERLSGSALSTLRPIHPPPDPSNFTTGRGEGGCFHTWCNVISISPNYGSSFHVYLIDKYIKKQKKRFFCFVKNETWQKLISK